MCMNLVRNECTITKGSLNSKLPTIWTVEKQSRVVKSAERRCNSAKVRRKKIHPRQMLEKSRNAVFFQWFVCRVSRKVGLLKRRVRSHVVRGEIQNCTPLWRKAHLEVKTLKNWRSRSTFWSSDVEKLHAAVAKNTFGSENVKKQTVSEPFWSSDVEELHAAVAKSTFGSEHVRKLTVLEPFWSSDVEKLHTAVAKNTFGSENVKKLTVSEPFWSSDVEKLHAAVAKSTFGSEHVRKLTVLEPFWSSDVEKLHAAVARSAFGSENVQNTWGSKHFLKFRCRKIARRCGKKHILKWKCAKHVSSGQFFELLMSKKWLR